MSFETVGNTIRSRYKTEVADAHPVSTQYDNQKFTPPSDTIWSRLTINFGESDQESTGGSTKRFRTIGVMTAQLFAPLNKGDKVLLELVDLIVSKFRSVTSAPVTFRTPSVSEGRRTPDGNWWQISVVCPWYTDDLG